METKEEIKSDFFVDLFLMMQSNTQGPQVTAREVIERHEEKMIGLGPILDRLQNEFLTPAIERVFQIMFEKDLLPPVPPALQGSDIKIEYTSIFAQASKMMGLAPIEQFTGFTGNLLGVDAGVIDNIDFDEMTREYADLIGLPAKILRDPVAVESMRAQRAEQAAAQQQAAAMQQSVDSGVQAAQGAKLLSEADVGPNNALTALLGANSAYNGGP